METAVGFIGASLISLKGVNWELLGSYTGLLAIATFCVYVGAYGSLPEVRASGAVNEEQEDDLGFMSSEDAWLFPVVGSLALGGIYLIIIYVGDYWLNTLLRVYFSFAGVGSVWKSGNMFCRYLVGEAQWRKLEEVKVTVMNGSREVVALSTRMVSVVLLPIAVVPSGLYLYWGGRSTLIGNILAMSYAHNAISMVKLDSVRTGVILLIGLFVYDVWWVFGTEVMVKVATTLDVPIKLVWPGVGTMLGLGDVVVPGLFVAAGLREGRCGMHGLLGGYVVGLTAAMVAVNVAGRAQPALLYVRCGVIYLCGLDLKIEQPSMPAVVRNI